MLLLLLPFSAQLSQSMEFTKKVFLSFFCHILAILIEIY